LSTYHGADGLLAIFGLIVIVAFIFVLWFTCVVLKLLMTSLFENIFVDNSSVNRTSRKYRKSNTNPNDFWDEPDMGTYVTMPNGEIEVCRVVTMPDFSGPSQYACISKPKTMPFVRYSCFRLN
jgi:cellobiose-specific phosphotransferase system component IIC